MIIKSNKFAQEKNDKTEKIHNNTITIGKNHSRDVRPYCIHGNQLISQKHLCLLKLSVGNILNDIPEQ